MGCRDGFGPCAMMLDSTDYAAVAAHLIEENEKLRETNNILKRQAYEDELTKVGNRRCFFCKIGEMIDSGVHPLVCVIDVNNFKEINDEYGHRVGDEVLEAIAKRLSAFCRSVDLACRLGGDEFGVIFHPPMDQDQATRRAEQCFDRPIATRAGAIPVSASIGSCKSRPGNSPGQVYELADLSMYEVKHGV